jgi:tetratricopeptide (TPR) repeat protein
MNTSLRSFARASLGLLLLAAAVPPARAQVRTDPEGLFNVGLAHLQEGRPEEAVEAFKKAIKLDGKNPYFHKGLAQAYLRLRRFPEAVDALRKALDINPYYTDARSDLGTALILAGKREEGRKEFVAVFDDPTNPTPELTARNIGMAYFEEKSYKEALSWFRTAIARNKAYPEANIRLADTLAVTGRLDEAVLVLEGAAQTMPDDLELALALGEAYQQVGRFGEARARLERVAGKDPTGNTGRRALDLIKNLPK